MTEGLIHFYYREGCHLCEEMAARLFREWPQVAGQMQWLDVDARDEWRTAYGPRVPVLTLNGQIVCEYFVDPGKMTQHFGVSANPL